MKRVLFVLLVFLAACASDISIQETEQDVIDSTNRARLPEVDTTELAPEQEIELFTADGVRLTALEYPQSDNAPGLVLAHMLGLDARSFRETALHWQSTGYHVLSLDLRGHGGSDGDLNAFTEDDFERMILDVETAVTWHRRAARQQISIIGASIGANAALLYAGSDEELTSVVALSPGENYRGLEPGETVEATRVPLFLVASEGDTRSYDAVTTLGPLYQEEPQTLIIEGNAHGTDMLSPGLIEQIDLFLEGN